MDWLLELDQDVFLSINSWHSGWADFVMYWVSDKLAWIPVYCFVLFALVHKYGWKQTGALLLMVIPLIVFSDQMASGLLKPNVARPRPCHEAELDGLVHLVGQHCGGPYGFAAVGAGSDPNSGVFYSVSLSRFWISNLGGLQPCLPRCSLPWRCYCGGGDRNGWRGCYAVAVFQICREKSAIPFSPGEIGSR